MVALAPLLMNVVVLLHTIRLGTAPEPSAVCLAYEVVSTGLIIP